MSSAADKYVQARAEGQSKLKASVRAVGTGMISYFTETLGGIGGSKSPLGKLEEKAGEKLITSILYNAFEEGGEEFLEYAADILLDGAADMAFKGEWQQEWSWEEVIENAKIGAMTGGLFGGYQRLMNKIYTGNPETDAQLDRAAREYADYIRDAYRLQSDPELRAMAERQMGETTIPTATRTRSGETGEMNYGSVFEGNAAGVQQNVEVFSEAQQRWNALLKESVEAKKAAGGTEKGGVQFSIKNIVGESGKDYGNGVYLDSNLLENLSDSERVEMVKMRIGELGGQTFTAYDGNTPVEIKIESSKTRFTNKKGRFVRVNNDLTTKNSGSRIKQETVVLADELILSSAHEKYTPAHYPHGWLDNKGQNEWERRTVFVQEKNNSVWKATLHIANTQNGEKILYDIDPIKKVESPRKLGATSTTDSIRQGEEKVNPKFSKRAEKLAQLDSEYAKAVESNDTETAERLVEEAARTAGYNSPLLYHGTQSFGFTKVDVSKSDDGISFFSTTNPDMAQTYSGEYGIRTIGKFSDRIINTLSLEQVVTRLNDLESNSKHPRKYYLMDRADVAKLEIKIKTETDTLLAEVQKLLEEKRNILARAREKNSWRADEYLDEIADTKYLIKALNNKDTVTMRDFAYGGDSYAVKFGDGLRELEANIRLKSKIDELGNVDRIFVGETEHRYTIGAFEAETARTILKGYDETGNYSLYGKTDDFFEIDGKGTYWSNIFATLEPKGGNTFRAEYDSNSSILKLSDKNGQFAEIPANTLSEAESAMAKAITKRYGEYFAANVLARAKDQLRNGALAEVNIKTVGRTSTREIAQFAKEQGYRGVKITNIYDNGGRGENAGTGDVYIFFNPETDVKSADAVTYDEEGNVIPLSERFNEKNKDIRFSKRKKLDTFNAEGYNEIKLGKQEYARLSAAIGTEQPNAKGIVTQILDNENGAPAFVYTAFIDNSGKLKIINKENAKYLGEGRRRYNANEKSKSFDRYAGEFENQRNDSDSSDFSIKRKANGRNDGVFSGIARGRDGRNGRGSNQDVSDSSEGSRKSLTVSNSTANGEVTLKVKKSTAEDDYTYDNIAIMLDGKEVGTIGMMADENEPYLERIDIDEAYRNKGIGTDALRLVAEKYGDFLIAPDNEDAKRLYERYGDESRQETHSKNHSPIIKAARAHFEHGLLFALCGYAVFILTRSLSAISAINSLLVGLPLPL